MRTAIIAASVIIAWAINSPGGSVLTLKDVQDMLAVLRDTKNTEFYNKHIYPQLFKDTPPQMVDDSLCKVAVKHSLGMYEF